MRTLILLFVVTAALAQVLPNGLPLPDIFNRLDRDSDGILTKKEAGNLWATMQRYDQDGNGSVDRG